MKKNIIEITGKVLSQKEMQKIKGGADYCPHSCQMYYTDRSGTVFWTSSGACFWRSSSKTCACSVGGGMYIDDNAC